jgi:hypothetical protein
VRVVDPVVDPAVENAPADSAARLGHGAADYFFRNLHQQLVQLSAQTDLKGNIMLTISALLIGLVTPQAVVDGQVRWGVVHFLVLDVGALLAAVLAVYPASAKLVGRPDPLYFAHAAQMPREDYVKEMLTIAGDRDAVYAAVAANLHSFSFYMHHGKFRYLRWSYTLFLTGAIGGLLVEGVSVFAS